MRSDKESFDSRWSRVDGGGELGGSGSGAGGMVAVKHCSGKCDEEQLEKTLVVDVVDWQRTDPSTMYALTMGEDDGGRPVLGVAMTHVYDGTGVVVRSAGPPGRLATRQKLINEIQART